MSSPLSAATPGRGDDGFRVPPSTIDSERLTQFCPFVSPSVRAAALTVRSSQASATVDAFRDITLSVGDFLDFRQSLDERKRPLCCVVVAFEKETPGTRLAKVFSVVRPCVADLNITAGLIPAKSVIRTGAGFSTTEALPTLMIFRSSHPRDHRFHSAESYRAAIKHVSVTPVSFFAEAGRWPTHHDQDGWRQALRETVRRLEGVR